MTEPEPRLQPMVFIIESPNAQDVLDGRAEGEALSAALKLAQIPNQYYRAYNIETFKESFDRIALIVYHQTTPRGQPSQTVFPHLHISAHGNKSGLQLTSGEFLSWHELRTLLLDLGKKTGFLRGGKSLLQMCFSTCMGAYAQEMFSAGPPYPCFAIIGPEQPVGWPDSLTAFITFYHQFYYRDSQAVDAVRIMNEAAGLSDIFSVIPFPGME